MTPPSSTSGIVTPANSLLSACKNEILELMKTVIEKCSQQVTLQLLEVSYRSLLLKVGVVYHRTVFQMCGLMTIFYAS